MDNLSRFASILNGMATLGAAVFLGMIFGMGIAAPDHLPVTIIIGAAWTFSLWSVRETAFMRGQIAGRKEWADHG